MKQKKLEVPLLAQKQNELLELIHFINLDENNAYLWKATSFGFTNCF